MKDVKRSTAVKRLKRYCNSNDEFTELHRDDVLIYSKDADPKLHNTEQYMRDHNILKDDEKIVRDYRKRKVMSDNKSVHSIVNYGNEQNYKIAKLKRDFGKDEVMKAIKDNGYTKATQVERHFLGEDYNQKMFPATKVYRAFERLDETEKHYAFEAIRDLFEFGITPDQRKQ